MGRNLYARLVAYQPHGDRIGVLPQPASFDALQEWDETGSLSFEYSMLTVGGDTISRQISTGTEIAVEVSDGGAWVEPASMRYLIIKREGDQTDTTGTLKFTCVSYGWLLNKILNLNTSALRADGDNKGKRPFLSATAGTIISTFVDENKARGGAGAYLAPGFDTGKDSAGAGWSRVSTLYYSLGVSLKTVIDGLVQGGVIDWDTQGRTLRVWNADSIKRSRDLSRTVIVQLAKDVLGIPYEESIEDLSSHILVSGDNDLIFTEDNPAAPTPWGKWESYVSQGGVSDKGTAQAFMQAELASAARMRGSYTAEMLTVDATNLPLIDYQCGDWITAPTISHGEKTRVQQIKLALDNTNGGASITCSVTLNDALMDSQVRQAKKINGITGGAALAGSESSRPAPAQDHRVPKAPEGLVLSSDAYVDDQGNALGVVYARWGEVTQATDGTAIDIDSYRVEWRYGDEADHWRFAGLTDGETLSWGGLDCGRAVVVRVRAIPTYSDKPGEWSGTVSVTVESDVTPPSVPSMPVLESELGVVRVRSDGLNNVGGGFEPDTAYLAVGRSASNGSWTGVGRIPVGGMWTDIGLSMGQTYWYALRAVDRSGNASAWSQGASIRVASAVTQDELDGLADRVTDAVDAVGEQQKVVSQVQTDLNAAKQQITANKTLADTGIEQAKQAAQAAAQAAASAQTTADGRNRIFHDWQDPTVSDPSLKPVAGDLWYRYQRFWTRAQGEPDNSPSLCANFYTYAQGEPDNSPSVLVPLASEIVEVLMWDGDSWNPYTLVASDVIASGSVSAELVDAEFFHGRTIVGGTYTTEGENVVINDTGILFQDDAKNPKLSFAKDGSGKWVLTVRDGIQSGGTITGSMLEGVTVTGSIVQTSGEERRGVKITDAGLAAYDGAGAANTVIDATTGRITMNGALISQGGIVSPTITGGVITGALFRSSESGYPRFELSGTDLDMWDSAKNHTVHLDGDGETSWLTGTFQTALSGRRVRISPSFSMHEIDNSDVKMIGSGIEMFLDGTAAITPYIASESSVSDEGQVSTIVINGGRRGENDPGAFFRIGERGTSGSRYGIAQMRASQKYNDGSSPRAYVTLNAPQGSGPTATIRANNGARYAGYYANGDGAYSYMYAGDANGTVGVQADIDSGYLYLGGYLGGLSGRTTLGGNNWRIMTNATITPQYNILNTTWSWTPAKYGKYYALANADVNFGSIMVHVTNTASPSQCQVVGFNAGSGTYKGDVYVCSFRWLQE